MMTPGGCWHRLPLERSAVEREVELMSSLNEHPNIVHLIEVLYSGQRDRNSARAPRSLCEQCPIGGRPACQVRKLFLPRLVSQAVGSVRC